MILGKLGLSFVVAGKLASEKDRVHLAEVNEVPPKFERNWWYTIPKINWNLLGRKGTVTRFGVHWLCFVFEIEWWKGNRWLRKKKIG